MIMTWVMRCGSMRVRIVLLALWVGSGMTALAQPSATYLIDLGRNNGTDGSITTSPDVNGRRWNNLQSPTQATVGNRTLTDLTSTTNGTSTIDLELIGDWQSNGRLNGGLFDTNGPSAALLGDLAISTATEDFYFLTGLGATGTVRLSGLEVGQAYHLVFFATRNTAAETRQTTYAAGGRTATLTSSGNNIGSNGAYDGNDNRVAGLYGVRANASGVIDVQVTVAAGGFGYINAMKILRAATLSNAKVLIDFGPAGGRHSVASADANGNWWSYVTGITGAGGNVTNLTTVAGTNAFSGINIALNWTGDVGVNGDPLVNWAINSNQVWSGLYGGTFAFFDVVKNGVYFNSSLTPFFTLSGLDDSKVYNLTFYGARGNFTRTTTYAVGTSNVTIQTGTSPSSWNTGTVGRLTGLVSTGGIITVNLSATGGFGYLNAMEIESAVRLTMTNTLAMLGPDAVTPLVGNASSGAVIQVIAVGGDNAIDPASLSVPGATTGDDYLLPAVNNPSFVGNTSTTNLGFLLQNLIYNESYAGLPVYVRYWNTTTITTNSFYGDSPIFYLPSYGIPTQTRVDVLPTGSSQATSFQIPTLGQWAMIALALLIAALAARRFQPAFR
jgi:hypothetical protein